jgi:hypothetical protein
MTYTHTYAIMDVSEAAYNEIKKKLEDAGYQHAIHIDRDGSVVLDMHGIALAIETLPPVPNPNKRIEERWGMITADKKPSILEVLPLVNRKLRLMSKTQRRKIYHRRRPSDE